MGLPLFILLFLASGVASQDSGCDCEVACAKLLAEQRQEIVRLQGELRALRGSPVAPAARRTADRCDANWVVASDEEAEALQGCRTVGSLQIGADVTTLASLQSLEEAEGISIRGNENLESLAGLETLKVVHGQLDIWDNPSLASLAGLGGLLTAKNITIYRNHMLASLAGLDNLLSVELLDIYKNGNLLSLSGLQALRTAGQLDIWDHYRLESCAGLESLTSVGLLDVRSNSGLLSLSGLESLQTVNNLVIRYNDQLQSLAGLGNVEGENVQADITENPMLGSLMGLGGVHTARKITIYRNHGLLSLAGLDSLSSVEYLDIYKNGNLLSLSGLQALRTAGRLDIWNHGQLESCAGLESLTSVDRLDVRSNSGLLSLWGLDSLQTVEDILILGNSQLLSLVGLESVEVVSGHLNIVDNPSLASLVGLRGLHAAKSIRIYKNDALASLTGLDMLSSVGVLNISNSSLLSLSGLESLQTAKDISVRDNGQLHWLVGLENVKVVSGHLDIRDNPSLASLVGLGGLHTAAGISIYNNDALASLTGLDNLSSVRILDIDGNKMLASLSGLQSLRTAVNLHIWNHIRLESCTGLESLTSVGKLELQRNLLRSLSGLEGLRSGSIIWISDNSQLESLAALAGLTSVDEMTISGLPRLPSLTGLENLRSVKTRLIVRDSDNLISLSGLQGLRTAGWIWIVYNDQLESLFGLGSLQVVYHLLTVESNDVLHSLDGLERLERVGTLELHLLPKLEALGGLPSLTHAWGGISITRCPLSSLLGLGRLLHAGQLQVLNPWESTRMQFLGGPLAAGAQVNVISIDDKSWPLCVTPHERTALLSAVGDSSPSSVPDATWQRWQALCPREFFEPPNCTKGHPCNFTLDGEERIFLAGRTTGCGFCSDGRLQTDVVEGVVDLGYALKDEETGPLSICRCGGVSGPVAQLLLRGPRHSGTTVCIRGHACTLRFAGELEPTHRIVLMSGSCDRDPRVGREARWAAENTYVLDNPEWYLAPPTRYQVCWRAPCTFAPDGPTCPAPEDRYFQVGEVMLLGPYPRDYMLVLGNFLSAANIGLGVKDGDWMHLRRACGEENEEGDNVLAANSTGLLFDFGNLTEDRVKAGIHRLCWCQERNGVACDTEGQFLAESGEVRVLCPVGQHFVSSGRCEECPPGTERREPGLEPCQECPVGRFSHGGKDSCGDCEDGTYTDRKGSSACVACRPWELANAEATGCVLNTERIFLQVLLSVSAGAFSAVLVLCIRRRPYVIDVSLDRGHTFVTTLRPHGFANFGCKSFPVSFNRTGHPDLDSPPKPLRATVHDSARLELITEEGQPIKHRLDTSMGRLVVGFPHDLLHQHRPLPPVLALPVLLITSMALFTVAGRSMMVEASISTAATAVVCAAATALLYRRPQRTPLTQRLSKA